MNTKFTAKETKKFMSRDERRLVRREYINYFLQNPAKMNTFSIRECVRMTEIIKCGSQLPVFYKNY